MLAEMEIRSPIGQEKYRSIVNNWVIERLSSNKFPRNKQELGEWIMGPVHCCGASRASP